MDQISFVKAEMPVRATRPMGSHGFIGLGTHRSREIQKALATAKTIEAARVIIDKANEGSPSVEEFRLRVINILEDTKKAVVPHETQIPVQLLEKWFKLQISNLCTKIAIRFSKDQVKTQEELRVAALKADEKVALAKAEERKEAFRKLTKEERKSHEVHLVQDDIIRPGLDLALNPHHLASIT